MIRFLPLALVFAFLVGCKDTAKQEQQPAQNIRIVSWNLNWFPGRTEDATAEAAKRCGIFMPNGAAACGVDAGLARAQPSV